jgi:hypothetical protein
MTSLPQTRRSGRTTKLAIERLESRAFLSASAPYAAGQPGDGTNQTFINNVYLELLGRMPDASGQAHWMGVLASAGSGQSARHEVVLGILGSAEYRADQITAIYEDFLGRAPDATGLNFWMGQMSGLGENVVLADLLASNEFQQQSGGNQQAFVDSLYADVLGRAPDAGGLAYWTNQFKMAGQDGNSTNIGPYDSARAAVVGQFLNSIEVQGLLMNNGTGSPLAQLTGDGWNQLFFQGSLSAQSQSDYEGLLADGDPYEGLIATMLSSDAYFG